MRVYVPSSVEQLASWLDRDVLDSPVDAWAVTDEARTKLSDLGEEETEYAVSAAAAEASEQLLADDARTNGRRVVVVTELSYSVVEPVPDEPGAVRVLAPIEGSRIDAVLADPDDIAVGDGADVADLCWFATQEIPELLASMSTD